MDDPLRVLKLGRLLNRQLQVSIRLRTKEGGVQSSASFHLRSAPPTHVSGAYRRGRDGRSVEGEGNQKRQRTLPYSLPLRVNLGYGCSQTFAKRAPWAWPRTPDLVSRCSRYGVIAPGHTGLHRVPTFRKRTMELYHRLTGAWLPGHP